jgi:hypothetical protein
MMPLPSRVVISLTFSTDSAEMRALPILPAMAHALQQSTLMKISGVRPPDIETRSLPALARRYPRDFTFYLGNPFPRLKLARCPMLTHALPPI